jgi:hypothetical protein
VSIDRLTGSSDQAHIDAQSMQNAVELIAAIAIG